jgi:hypothetical protein
MEEKLIKILNPNKANYLINLGFIYTKEQINNQDIYVFVNSPEILKLIQNNFEKCDFFFEKTLYF